MQQFDRIYQAIWADEITYFFCALIIGWLIAAIILALFSPLLRSQMAAKFIAMTPNSLASLGVLGTFTGILIGLLDFDVTRVDDSVPELLAGLKVAFTTSIVGISAAIAFRLVRAAAPSGNEIEGVTPEVIHSALLDIRNDARNAAERSTGQLDELRKAISSEGDSSLITQVQKLRTTIQDGQSELIREFRDFAKHMAENNQKALIEALEQVIRDFNKNLTEQFGENFKQLNEAVHSLVGWQENYRQHVETVEQRLELATTAIEHCQTALESVQEHAGRIPQTIELLEPVLVGVNTQTEMLGSKLEAVAALREKAIEAFPTIEANLDKITTQVASMVQEAVQKLQKALADGEATQAQLRKGFDAFLQDAENSRERFSAELTNSLKQMSDQSAQEFARHGQLIEASAKEAQKVINESWSQSVGKMNDQFEEFDRQMQQELTRSLELLGRNLASVSEKFVTDYTPLTQRLRELVNVTRETV